MKRSLLKILIALAWIGGVAEAACGQTTSITAPSGSITMGGSPIATGTVVFLPVDVNGHPIAVTKSGGGLNLPGSSTQPVGYLCSITAGAITGTCSIPDEVTSSPSGFRYNITISDTSTGNPTSGDSFQVTQVQGVTGSTYALNNYTPTAIVQSVFANTFTSGSGAPTGSCAVPSVYVRTDIAGLYICANGAYVAVVGGNGTGQGFTFMGAWAANTNYVPYEVVTYNGSTYESSTSFTSTSTFNPSNWNLWAAAGAAGPAPGLTVGAVTTLSAGATPTASFTGTPPNYTLNLGIPAGANGVTPTLAIGTVSSLAAGATPTATITGTAPNYTLNLGIPAGAPGASVALQTNNAANTSQTKLNLVAGTGITLSSDSSGDVTITSTVSGSGITLKTGGAANTSQAVLNLVGGTGVTLASDGSGDVTITSTQNAVTVNGATVPASLSGIQTNSSGQFIQQTAANALAVLSQGYSPTATNFLDGVGGWQNAVTSLSLNFSNGGLSCTGVPVTTSGTITCSYSSQVSGTFLGSPCGSSGVPTLRGLCSTDLPVFVGSGAGHAPGAVPDAGSTAGSTRYLREDGTWNVPAGGSGVSALNSLTGSLNLAAGSGITVTPSGTTITISAGTTPTNQYFALNGAQYLSTPGTATNALSATAFRLGTVEVNQSSYSAGVSYIWLAKDSSGSAATRFWNFYYGFGDIIVQLFNGSSSSPFDTFSFATTTSPQQTGTGTCSPSSTASANALAGGTTYYFYVNVNSALTSASLYCSTTGANGQFYQYGSTQTASGGTLNTTSPTSTPVTIGAQYNGTSYYSNAFIGNIYFAQAYSDNTGTTSVLNANANNATSILNSFTDPTDGEVWTMTPSSFVVVPGTNQSVTMLSGATPTIAAGNGLYAITLTASATPTITGIQQGQHMTFEICQNSTGGYTWTWPSAFHGGMTIGTAASTCSSQTFNSFNGTSLIPDSAGTSGVTP